MHGVLFEINQSKLFAIFINSMKMVHPFVERFLPLRRKTATSV